MTKRTKLYFSRKKLLNNMIQSFKNHLSKAHDDYLDQMAQRIKHAQSLNKFTP